MAWSESRWTLPDWPSALRWSRERNSQGIKAILDILGGPGTGERGAATHLSAYVSLIEAIAEEGLNASISVKVSALGYKYDRTACLQNLLAIAKEADRRRVGFEMDMEGRSMVDFTVEAAQACIDGRYPLTLALQAYLDRTDGDLASAIEGGIRVRLVKGAYVGDIKDFQAIQDRFKELAGRLLESGRPFCIGTHDPELIAWALINADQLKGQVELGMLKGLSDRTKLDLVDRTWSISEYVPYGRSRAAYEARRRNYLDQLAKEGRGPAP